MSDEQISNISTRRGLLALSPVVVFLALYLVVSIVIGDFYKMPLAVCSIPPENRLSSPPTNRQKILKHWKSVSAPGLSGG